MNTHGVTVRTIRFLRGPNVYAYMPVVQVVLDTGPYERQPSTSFPAFPERLAAWLPGLRTHACSVGHPGGLIERLHRGTYLAHICEHVTLELQSLMGFPVYFGRTRGTGERGVYTVVVEYKEEEPARAAFETALRLTLAAMHDEPVDVQGALDGLLAVADEHRLGPSTAAIVAAARTRAIPVLRLNTPGSLVQLGYGVHQKRILASETTQTSAIAVDICQEKPLANRMLRAMGIPVPDGYPVTSADDAWAAAQDLGLPVVVKPEAGNQGKGVSVQLTSEAEVRDAYAVAYACNRGDVLVEEHIDGHDYRLLVVNGAMVAAARRDPARVVGDGRQTIGQLVETVNQDQRRRPGHSGTLTRITLDEATELALARQGMTTDAVPEPGRVIALRTNSNLSTGGTASDVTDEVHPGNAHLAELAAQILALDVAGIDIVCRDIGRPVRDQGGAIVEVNAAPGLRMHLQPTAGQPRPVGVPIVDMLYARDAPSRIPIIAVTGTNGKTTVTRLISHMYETARYRVGMTSTQGIVIAGERVVKGDCAGPQSARAVLLHPRVEVAVLETARGGILREGLAFDWCTVGVVTNVSSDHLGLDGIDTLEDLARVKQVVIESVHKDGAAVLNADDPLVAEMAAVSAGPVVYFSRTPGNHIVQTHLAHGGRCVFVSQERIILATGDARVELVDLQRLGFTAGGRIPFQVQNTLAAVAATWAAGLNPAIITRALTTFTSDAATVPGRFNVSEVGGVQVIVDYGHNAAAMVALGEAVACLGVRRTLMVLTLPGDRRDDDIMATVEATRPFVDEYVLQDSDDLRGRAPDEIVHLMQRRVPSDVPSVTASGFAEGLAQAWQRVGPGDRLIIIAELVDEIAHWMRQLAASPAEEAACVSLIGAEAAVR